MSNQDKLRLYQKAKSFKNEIFSILVDKCIGDGCAPENEVNDYAKRIIIQQNGFFDSI